MSKNSKIKETRKMLSALSKQAKEIKNAKGLSDSTINEILLDFIYDTQGATQFNTFHQWKRLGYTILKGAKAFVIWGQPTKGVMRKQAENENKNEGEDEYEFFPLCYLFSDKQVFKSDENKPVESCMVESVPESEFLNI